MSESSGSHGGLGFRLDIKQILLEAQHRWLRSAEICEILRNSQKFHISPEAPNKPVSGSVFLFDRKVLRYFRKDGHNWRKKKDGKTIKEAHEKLKVGSVDMLHCYYAHGEDNENFQRRSYWLLEQDLMHIVFVHYLEVKGNKSNAGCVRNPDSMVSNSENDSSLSSSYHGTSPISTLSSAYEDAESEDNHQASSRLHSYPGSPATVDSHSTLSSSHNLLSSPGTLSLSALNYESLPRGHKARDPGGGNVMSGAQTTGDFASWQEVLGNCATEDIAYKPEPYQAKWQHPLQDGSLNLYSQNMNQNLNKDAETRNSVNPNFGNRMKTIGHDNHSFLVKKPLISGLQTEESLKKVDSFSRWMANELGEVDELNTLSSNEISWSIMGGDYDSNMADQLQGEEDTMSPSISQDQLFSIIDFSPNWAYSNLATKVLITGTFLRSEEELSNCRWSFMFGEVEVPADVLADGILCCHAPLHKPGLVPFYLTCSNRSACSEIREFEYKLATDHFGTVDVNGDKDKVIAMHLYRRFETILCLEPVGSPVSYAGNDFAKQHILSKIVTLMEEENREEASLSSSELKVIGELLLERQLKQKFYSWIIQKVTEDGKGLTVVDEGGQSVLHLSAALGFKWALQAIIVSEVSIDFRDVSGWTALHWAAYYGREDTVAALVSLGAAPGALTDPTAEHPLGRTPADLASSSGHKGISGFLAETFLTTHLTTLKVNDQQEDGNQEVCGARAVQTISERLAVPTTGEDVPDTLSLKDSLAAICNATQAAARIHQIFRVQSFQRKQLNEQDSDEYLTEDESLEAAVRTSRLGHTPGPANAAALSIQKKFRGWKKRKEFLSIRQKIVKIQAHVRGHQVRKKYKTFVWSVGILEKVILRWRRKRSGLRGFRSDDVVKSPNIEEILPPEDDYDFLKEGRKQTEERMHKALDRVKSMAQYPEARAQYRRLLTAAEEFRENKDASDMSADHIEMLCPVDDLIDVEALWDDDTFMSLAFQ